MFCIFLTHVCMIPPFRQCLNNAMVTSSAPLPSVLELRHDTPAPLPSSSCGVSKAAVTLKSIATLALGRLYWSTGGPRVGASIPLTPELIRAFRVSRKPVSRKPDNRLETSIRETTATHDRRPDPTAYLETLYRERGQGVCIASSCSAEGKL